MPQAVIGPFEIQSIAGIPVLFDGANFNLASPIQKLQSSPSFGTSMNVLVIGTVPIMAVGSDDYVLFTFLQYPFAWANRGIQTTKGMTPDTLIMIDMIGDFATGDTPTPGVYSAQIGMQVWQYSGYAGDYTGVVNDYGAITIGNFIQILSGSALPKYAIGDVLQLSPNTVDFFTITGIQTVAGVNQYVLLQNGETVPFALDVSFVDSNPDWHKVGVTPPTPPPSPRISWIWIGAGVGALLLGLALAKGKI